MTKIMFLHRRTENEVRDAIISNKLKTVEEVSDITKAGTGCAVVKKAFSSFLDEINK